jgi:hypothetical protein
MWTSVNIPFVRLLTIRQPLTGEYDKVMWHLAGVGQRNEIGVSPAISIHYHTRVILVILTRVWRQRSVAVPVDIPTGTFNY